MPPVELDDDVPVNLNPEEDPAYLRLKQLRTRTDLEARPSPLMRDSFVGLDGRERPIRLRYYQVQGVMHLLAMKRFLLGDDTGLGKCVTPDTLVPTNRGLVRLREMNPGGMAPDTFAPISGWRVSVGGQLLPVKNFYYGGSKPTLRVTTRYGYQVEGSLAHPLLVRTEDGREVFKKLPELKVGDHLCVDRRAGSFAVGEPALPLPDPGQWAANAHVYQLPERMTPELARLLAYIVGEGWTVTPYDISVTQHRDVNPESHDDIRYLFRELFGWEGNKTAKNKDTTIGVCSVQIRTYLAGLGVDYVLSREKRVPPSIFRSTRESVRQFLRGIFESEASTFGSGQIEFSSSSRQLAREVHLLLLQFGIVGKLEPTLVKGYDHTYWILTLSGDAARLYRDTIGFVSLRKQQALEENLPEESNTNHDVIPGSREMVGRLYDRVAAAVRVRGANAARKGSGMVRFDSLIGGYQYIKSGRSAPSYRFLRRLLTVSETAGTANSREHSEVEEVVRGGYFYDPIVSLEPGESEVVDVEVDSADHAFVGNGLVNHNTLQSIAALCYLWEKNPNLKVVVLTSKSAVEQWAGEFTKFTRKTSVYVCRGEPKQRRKIREQYLASKGPTVIVMGYRGAVQDYADMQDWSGFVFITDEAAYYKNPETQIHQACFHLSQRAERTWALTATLIKNNLVEGWGVYRVVVPGLFGSLNQFMNEYCITRMQQLPGTRRQVPVIVGYRGRDIKAFRDRIDPYFLGRPKFEVASELPPLVTRTVACKLTHFQQEKYAEALSGLLSIGVRDQKTGAVSQEEKEVTPLTAVTYCQQIVNHPELIGSEGDSDKLDTLLDLALNGELAGEKIIVYSRFSKMVDILVPALRKAGVETVRITGEEDEKERKKAQDSFQDPSSAVRVVCITDAAAEAINLQMAKAIVFYDTPWSAGNFLQILGRMIRIGSTHDRCYALHLVVPKTIDDRVVKVLGQKMTLVESVLGKRLKGLDEGVTVDVANDLSDLFEGLLSDARGTA